MPIRDYKCIKCGQEIEVIEKMDADPVKPCFCGSKLVRQVSKASPHFKGKGFYSTDY